MQTAIETLKGQISFKKDQLKIYTAEVKDEAVKSRIKEAYDIEIGELQQAVKVLEDHEKALKFMA